MSHHICMAKYGSDRPDLRFGMELHDLNSIAQRTTFSVFLDQLSQGGIVKGLCVKGGADISRKAIEEYTQFVSHLGIKGLAWIKYQESGLSSTIVKFFPEMYSKNLLQR